jgi:hypothetical protein
VTLTAVGKTVTRGRIWLPELAMDVVVNEDVSLITVTFGVAVDVGAVDVWRWAKAESMREAKKRREKTPLG